MAETFVDFPLCLFFPNNKIYNIISESFNVSQIPKNFYGIIAFNKKRLVTQHQSPKYQTNIDLRLRPPVDLVIKFILNYGNPAQNQKATESHEKYCAILLTP